MNLTLHWLADIVFWLGCLIVLWCKFKEELQKQANAFADIKLQIMQAAVAEARKSGFEQGMVVGEKRAAMRTKPE